jgi:uncharacterized protein (DUF427 family)
MAVQMQTLMSDALEQLRVHPIHKWIKASLDDAVVVDTTRAQVVWEPRRVVPSYAVPSDDIDGDLIAYDGPIGTEEPVQMARGGPPVLTPGTPFTVHTSPGDSFTIRTECGDLAGAAFTPADPDLNGYVVLDWDAFTQWREEDEQVIGHPHDPFDRIDCLQSSRHVVMSLNDHLLADTTQPTLLFETPLPARYYIPREDVRMDLLEPSPTSTVCAYKGTASYFSAKAGQRLVPDIAWTYRQPLHDAQPVQDMISFFTERVDLVVDGTPVPRPQTPWS